MSNTTNNVRFGVYYVSNGRWTGPWSGATFTKNTLEHPEVKQALKSIRNRVLKSRTKLRRVF